ncbi:hypothetical protein GGQ97_002294 [Sphingomonas kaistensis]|uniref:Uncharacterized protein n=1 Tax=Sphingomonas kaistensis TaxID=298708 RepID=A0A7X6BHV2_9SPHN|nr:hypothetical protein [Sphingomonas kaistensis]NJC06501.1 hypothetical protein [Sphingomonas kaistensis]
MNERQWFTVGLFGLTAAMLFMAWLNPALWDVKLFEVMLQAVVITGLLNMAAAFHFAANKNDEKRVDNTSAAFRAIEAAASQPPAGAAQAAEQVANAAQDEAAAIKGER